MFVRKRDPRYKAHLRAQSLPPVAPSLLNPPSRQAGVESITAYVEQEWQKTSVSGVEDLEWALAEGNGDPEVFECVVCGKSFKSEAAWNSHERSKKHIRNVEVLRRQMEEEGAEFGLPANPSDEVGSEPAEGGEQPGGLATPPVDNGSDTGHEALRGTETPPKYQAQTASIEETLPKGIGESKQILPPEENLSKRDKRRLREAKKQAQVVEDAHVSD
jgi:DnaJ family protein A protein 5